MIIQYNGEDVEVTPEYNDDGSIKIFRSETRTYHAGAVIYPGCPQTKYDVYTKHSRKKKL
jgi:hypothetical protein